MSTRAVTKEVRLRTQVGEKCPDGCTQCAHKGRKGHSQSGVCGAGGFVRVQQGALTSGTWHKRVYRAGNNSPYPVARVYPRRCHAFLYLLVLEKTSEVAVNEVEGPVAILSIRTLHVNADIWSHCLLYLLQPGMKGTHTTPSLSFPSAQPFTMTFINLLMTFMMLLCLLMKLLVNCLVPSSTWNCTHGVGSGIARKTKKNVEEEVAGVWRIRECAFYL